MNLSGAISAGFTIKQILNYLGETFPELGSRIKDAVKAGKSADDIVKYLSKVDKNQMVKYRGNQKPSKIYPQESSQNPFISASQAQKNYDPIPQSVKTAGKIGLGLAGSYGASKLLPKAIQGIQGFLGSSAPNIGPQPMSNAPASTNQGSLQPNTNTQPSPQQTQQPPKSPTQISPAQSIAVIDQMGIGSQIQTMQAAGNSPEAIASAIGVTMKPNQRKWLDEQIKAGNAKSLPDLVTDYLSQSQPSNEKISPEITENVQKQPEFQEKTKLKPQKGELVATADGEVGEIKSQRNGKALVDLNGKLHQEEEKSLEMPNEELIQAVEKLLNLPEIEKSAIISSLVYRPSKKEMFVKFHNGTRYVYEDVDEEDIRPIAEAMGMPVTTGQNIYGAWEKGKQDSRGAALIHGIIRNAKYSKEQEGKTWEKLDTKYDRHQKLHRQPKRKRKE